MKIIEKIKNEAVGRAVDTVCTYCEENVTDVATCKNCPVVKIAFAIERK